MVVVGVGVDTTLVVRTSAGGTLLASGSSVVTIFCLRGFFRAGAGLSVADAVPAAAVPADACDVLADLSPLLAEVPEIAAAAVAANLFTLTGQTIRKDKLVRHPSNTPWQVTIQLSSTCNHSGLHQIT